MRRSNKKILKSKRSHKRRSHKRSVKKCKDCKKCKISSKRKCMCDKKSCKCYKLRIRRMFGLTPPMPGTSFIRGF